MLSKGCSSVFMCFTFIVKLSRNIVIIFYYKILLQERFISFVAFDRRIPCYFSGICWNASSFDTPKLKNCSCNCSGLYWILYVRFYYLGFIECDGIYKALLIPISNSFNFILRSELLSFIFSLCLFRLIARQFVELNVVLFTTMFSLLSFDCNVKCFRCYRSIVKWLTKY